MGYADANGAHTYYEEHGSGEPLLLLHGGLVDGDSFAHQTPAFAERYRVIVPDRRGHGRTADVDGPIMHETWKVNAAELDRFDTVLEKMEQCWFDYAIPTADLARIATPTLVMVGDDDITRSEHTIELYDTIPDAQLAVIPGASHLVPLEKPDLVNELVLDFLAAEGPTMTMNPIRRG